MGEMPGEFYFMAMGGLGVSLAGFAGLIAALDRRPASADSPVRAWRIRNIVIASFILPFAGFGTVATFAATGGDDILTARIISLFLAFAAVVRAPSESRPGPEWPSERGRLFALALTLVYVLAALANVVIGSLAGLQLLFLVQLSEPVSIFMNTIRDIAGRDIARRPEPADTSRQQPDAEGGSGS